MIWRFMWVVGLWVFWMFSPPASEAELFIGPSVLEVAVRPGETGSAVFEITNRSDQDMQIKVEAVNWLVRYLGREGDVKDVYEWLDLGELDQFTVPARSQSTLTYDLIAPKDFEGERVAQVFFEYEPTEPTPEQERTMKMLKQRIGVLLCFAAKGTEVLKGKLKVSDVASNVKEDGTVDVTARYTIKNQGNVHFRPRGKVRIKKKKEIVAETELTEIRGLFAEEQRAYEANLSGLDLPRGKYKLELEIDIRSFALVSQLRGSKKLVVRT